MSSLDKKPKLVLLFTSIFLMLIFVVTLIYFHEKSTKGALVYSDFNNILTINEKLLDKQIRGQISSNVKNVYVTNMGINLVNITPKGNIKTFAVDIFSNTNHSKFVKFQTNIDNKSNLRMTKTSNDALSITDSKSLFLMNDYLYSIKEIFNQYILKNPTNDKIDFIQITLSNYGSKSNMRKKYNKAIYIPNGSNGIEKRNAVAFQVYFMKKVANSKVSTEEKFTSISTIRIIVEI